jgi:hypothetical protein
MNRQLLNWSHCYQAALTNHLAADDPECPVAVRALGSEILAAGLPMLDLAKLHEQFLLGRREAQEMVGGRFGLESAPGEGTTIEAFVPDGKVVGVKRGGR